MSRGTRLLLFLLAAATKICAEPPTCDILTYDSLTATPKVTKDTQDTCPPGNGPRAYVKYRPPPNAPPSHHALHGEGVQLQSKIREVAPTPYQRVNCLTGRDCAFAIRGFGVGALDGITVLPLNITGCPPKLDLDGNDEKVDMPTVVEAERHAAIVGAHSEVAEISYAVFNLPERALLAPGIHTICYAPALAVRKKITDELKNIDFHYDAGILHIGDWLLHCTFEEAVRAEEQGDFTEVVLPCNFRNFRDRFTTDLIWQVASGKSPTAGTGPVGDATAGQSGNGSYLTMRSPGYALGSIATVVSPPMVFPQGGYCAQFAYNMNGADVSSLRSFLHAVKTETYSVDAGRHHREFTDDGTTVLGVWGSPKWVAVGNKGEDWHRGGFEFRIPKESSVLQLVFEAVAGKSEYADIAIDDVKVTPGRCPAEIRHHLPKTIGFNNQPMVCGEVRLVSGSHSADKSWFVEGAISCAGAGYSLDNTAESYMPCCVPGFGTYKLVLQDAFGDGWSNSRLEFRFFNRLLTFGDKDDFKRVGYSKTYDLTIGTVEVEEVIKRSDSDISLNVRVARAGSHVWCGVVPAGRNGKPLKVDLSPDLLKAYGVRSEAPTKDNNEVQRIPIKATLKPKTAYDLYCHSERWGDPPPKAEAAQSEILASRLRLTTDAAPPELVITNTTAAHNSIKVSFKIDESGTVWCAALKVDESLFGQGGPLSNLDTKKSLNETDWKRVTDFFDTYGTGIDVDETDKSSEGFSVEITGLSANAKYKVYCYAEDTAAPTVNRLPLSKVGKTERLVETLAKVPTVRLVRKTTLHRGFRIHVTADAPGHVYCAAAPADYGVPNVQEVVDVGASAEIKEPNKELALELKGVEPNTAYSLYCVASAPKGSAVDQKLTSTSEMILSSATAVSYGRYCEEEEGVEIYTITNKKTPFHPITAEEEMKIRNFILSKQELGLEGVYRITLLPNKREIYKFYDEGAAMPNRYARVRAGRCIDKKGFYEQYKVGPLHVPATQMTYERISPPIETECAGYNPQGVFGRRRLMPATSDQVERLNAWLEKAFNFSHGTDDCKKQIADMLHVDDLASAPHLYSGQTTHPHYKTCADVGPVIVEEANDEHGGRVWVGLRSPSGDQIPVYFLYDLADKLPLGTGTVDKTWAQKLIRERRIPEDFHHVWDANEIFVDGKHFKSLSKLIGALDAGEFDYLSMDHVHQRVEEKRRRLLPDPFPGAPGTAGPGPKRLTRRSGLENRSHPEHIEAQGKRFTVTASATEEEFTVDYAGWSFTFVNDRDTSLRFYNVMFQGQRVAFELGLMEALAHYSVSERNFFFMDSWYGGLGAAARRVHKGVECPKTALGLFWDGSVCIFEQDEARPYRSHWKSGEIRDAAPQVLLVVRQMLTVSNYDYVTDYRFHLTGMIEGSVSFTGELYAGIEVPWYSARQSDYGVQVTGAMRLAALHNHLAAWKIDFDIGKNWDKNSLLLTQVIGDPNRPGAHKLSRKFADSEKEGVFRRDDLRQMIYEIVDEKWNIFGNYGGYRIHPGPGLIPQNMEFELYAGPAAWAKYRCFTTLHKYGELDVSLPRDNKFAKRPAVSVDRYINDNESIRNGDLVVWISDGVFHIPVVEDMPQTIPVGNKLGWLAKPANMFYEDPSMDLWNAMGGGVKDPGTCAVVRMDISEAEPTLADMWKRDPLPPPAVV